MRMGLGYVFIAILWCLFIISAMSMIELGANIVHSTVYSLERLLALFCCSMACPIG
jgi:hypothetical protein